MQPKSIGSGRVSVMMVALLAAMVTACGGGGGSGEAAPTPSPPPTASGLVPTAGTLGATLEDDATQLRVLRPGASWHYAGEDFPDGPNRNAQAYSNIVTHVAAASGVIETASDGLHAGIDSVTVQAGNGTVRSRSQVQPVPNVPPDAVDVVELRSPVRIGDQYTLYDRRFNDAGVDLDGDRINETLDFAVWAQVVGSETLDLPQRHAVRAVRVDTTIARRIRYSATAAYGAVELAQQRVWYAKGIGVIQVELDRPHPTERQLRQLTRERLNSWDGLTEGLGALPLQLATVPSGPSAGQRLSGHLLGAVGFDNHAIAMTSIRGFPPAEGVTLTTIDANGRATASIDHRGNWTRNPRLVRMSNELRLLAANEGGDIIALAFDAQGRTRAPDTQVLIPASNRVQPALYDAWFQVAVGGNRLWLLTLQGCERRDSSTIQCDLVLQAFDQTGQAIGGPQVIAREVATNTFGAARLIAAADRVVAIWQLSGLPSVWQLAVADAASGLVLHTRALNDINPINVLHPAAMDPGVALVYADIGSGAGDPLNIVALDSSYVPIRRASGDAISPPWMMPAALHGLTVTAGRMHLLSSRPVESGMLLSEVNWNVGTGANATPSVRLLGSFPYLSTGHLVHLSDRLLVLGGRLVEEEVLATVVVWPAR